MKVTFVYEKDTELADVFDLDVLPRVGDSVQFLNPVGHPMVVSRVYWQCAHATLSQPAIASVQVLLRPAMLDEIAPTIVPLRCDDLARIATGG